MKMKTSSLLLFLLLSFFVPGTMWAQDGVLHPVFQASPIMLGAAYEGIDNYGNTSPTALHFDANGTVYVTYRNYYGIQHGQYWNNSTIEHVKFNAQSFIPLPDYGNVASMANATQPLDINQVFPVGGAHYHSIFISNDYHRDPYPPLMLPDRESVSLVTPSGETYIAGTYARDSGTLINHFGYYIRKLDRNGVPDPTFNNTGMVLAGVSDYFYNSTVHGLYNTVTTSNIERVWGIAQQSTGHIILARTQRSNININTKSFHTSYYRYSPSGALVSQSGFEHGTTPIRGVGIGVDAQDRVIFALTLVDSTTSTDYLFITRSTPSNLLLSTGAQIELPFDSSSVRQVISSNDGKTYIVMDAYSQGSKSMTVMRLNADLSLDTGYGTSGYVTESFGGAHYTVSRMVQQRDGKIVIGVTVQDDGLFKSRVMRLNIDGTPDLTFGNQGIHQQNYSNTEISDIFGFDVDITEDGSIVVGEMVQSTPNPALFYGVIQTYSLQNPSQFYNVGHKLPAHGRVSAKHIGQIQFSLDQTATPQAGKYIRVFTSGGSQVEQIEATDARVTLSADTTLYGNYLGPRTGKIVSVELNSHLPTRQEYYVLVDSGAFKNSHGNDFWGITDPQAWRFSSVVTDSVAGNTVDFSGTPSEYISIPFSSDLNPSDNFTIEFWARPEGGAGQYRCPLSSENTEGGTTQRGYYFYASPNNTWQAWLGNGLNGNWSVIDGPAVTLNEWTHMAMTYSGGTQTFYVNGEVVGTAENVPFHPNLSMPFLIGGVAEAPSVYNWNGKVDEVRLWGVARTQAQIRENMHRTIPGPEAQNLIMYHQLNEGSGTSTTDDVGGFVGTFSGNPAWVSSTVATGPATSGSQATATSLSSASVGSLTVSNTDAFDNAIDLMATQIKVAPNAEPTGASDLQNDRYWIVKSFGNPGMFATIITFPVSASFTSSGSNPAAGFRLFRRNLNSEGSWHLYKSGADSVKGTSVTFSGIDSLGQFMVGMINASVQITGTEGWRLISAPTTGLTFNDVLGNLWTQGFTGADISGGTSNVYQWQTNTAQGNSSNWTSITNQSAAFNIGSAVLMYVFGDDNGPGNPENTGFPKSLVINSGLENAAEKSFTSSLNTNIGGWTLLGNPFGAAFDWDLVSKSGLSNSVYVYDNNASTWKTWNNVTGSLTDGKVGKMNGFFVETTSGSPTLTVPVSSKLSGQNVFLGKQAENEAFQTISLEITGPTGYKNEAFMLFSTEGQEGMDNYDAVKLVPLSPTFVQLSSLSSEGKVLETNHLPVPSGVREIPLQISTTFSGDFKFRVSGIKMNGAWTLTLVDKQLNKSYALDSEITLNLEAGKFKGNGGLIPKSGPLAETADAAPRFVLVLTPETTTNAEVSNFPAKTALLPAFPNPFNPSTTLSYQLAEAGNVELSVYDLNGRRIASLVNGRQAAGSYKTQWQAAGISSGVYLIRMQTGKSAFVQKITLLK